MYSIINLIFLVDANIHTNIHILKLGIYLHFFQTYAKIYLDNERKKETNKKATIQNKEFL